MAASRLDDLQVVLAVVVGGGRLINPVPQPPQDVRIVHVPVVEGDHHLISDLGEEEGASLLSRHHGRNPDPAALVPLAEPGEFDLYPLKFFCIPVVGYDPEGE